MLSRKQCIKVGFFIPGFIVGGVETVFINTLEELLKISDLDISIVTHMKVREPLYVEWFKMHPEIPVYTYLPLGNWFQDLEPKCHGITKLARKITFSLYKKYRRFIWRRKFKDMDVFIDYKNFEFVRELRHISKPKIAWLHGSLAYFEKDKNFLKKVKNYTNIIGLTDDFVEEFKTKYPKYSDKIVRIYNPINITHIQQLSNQGKIPRGKYFCHVSRLDKGKDIKTLLDAFDIFYKSHKNVKLYVIGNGPLANDHKSYAARLKSCKNIVFTGTKYNPYIFMKGAIANILSSEHEGLPTVVLESVALGVPCISANCESGPREILQDGKGGWLFEIGNAEMLAQEMSDVFEFPAKAKKLTDVATKGLKRFSQKVVTKQIYDLINGVVKHNQV